VSADLGFDYDGDAVVGAERVGSAGEQERGDVGVQRLTAVDMSVVLAVDGVAEQRPSVAVVVFDVVAGIQEFAECLQVVVFDGEVSRRPGCHGRALVGRIWQ
jgi:hypothetical protein